MDPNTCLKTLQGHLDKENWDEVEWAAKDLYAWLDNGGVPPDTFHVNVKLSTITDFSARAMLALLQGHGLDIRP